MLMTRQDTARSDKRRGAREAVVAIAASMLFFTSGALAQDEAKVKAGLEAWKNSGCSECHGAYGDGEKERDEAPTGANLRTMRLDDAALRETIRCGRVNTGMPRFGQDAYTPRGCYGQPPSPVPDALYPTPRMMSAEEIDAVVAYLRARVIGKRGPVTPRECADYHGELAATFC